MSWETLLTCCFTPHRLSSLWNGGLLANSGPARHKQADRRKTQAGHAPAHAESRNTQAASCSREHPCSRFTPRDRQTVPTRTHQEARMRTSSRNASSQQTASRPEGRLAANHLMGLLMLSMPGKPRPASSSRRRAQGRSPPARCSSCQNRASWRARSLV